jgi:hypothetical protein
MLLRQPDLHQQEVGSSHRDIRENVMEFFERLPILYFSSSPGGPLTVLHGIPE